MRSSAANGLNYNSRSEFSNDKKTPDMADSQCYNSGLRELRPPVNLENGTVYEGEWLNDMRDGHGRQEWLDGS